MKPKSIILLIFFTLFLSGCGNQFTCGYDPDSFKLTDSFSINRKDIVGIEFNDIVKIINKFGLENGYCVADGSIINEKLSDDYLVNIRIVKDNLSFYVRGSKKYIFWLQQKSDNFDKNEIKLFCDLFKPFINKDNITYYDDKGKLCSF